MWSGNEITVQAIGYSIRISQRMIEARSMSGTTEIPGLKSIEGWLDESPSFELIGKSIELELEDGRRWKCFIQSGDGNLVNRGGIN